MEAVKEEKALVPEERRGPIDISLVHGVIPRSYNELLQFAKLYKESGLAPKSFQTTQQLAIAIGMCLEVGRPILTGLQDMAVINNRVGVFGDATLAIIRSSGLLESFEQWEEGDPYTDQWTVYTKVKRKGQKERTDYWSWADSKRAGFDDPKMRDGNKDHFSPWRRFTRRMMYFKSRNFLLRDEFGDVLKGMNTVEELQEYIDVSPDQKPIPTAKPVTEAPEGTDIYATKEPPTKPEDVKPEKPETSPDQPPSDKKEEETEGEEPLFDTLKKMRPSAGDDAMIKWKEIVAEKADEIRKLPQEEYAYITKKWAKACPGDPFPARPLTKDEKSNGRPQEEIENNHARLGALDKMMKLRENYPDEGKFYENLIEIAHVDSINKIAQEEMESVYTKMSRALDELNQG